MLPEFGHLTDTLRVIDVPRETSGLILRVLMNADLDQAVAFLSSPQQRIRQIESEIEISLRAMLDARIRAAGETELPLSAMMYYAAGHDTTSHRPGVSCPKLHARLKSVQQLVQSLPNQQPPSGWAKYFQAIAVAMGWPGERTLTSAEYQTVEAFKEALSQFAAFDLVAGQMDMAAATGEFNRMLADTIFQPETGDAPVQILGILESVGERFSHLWVMGLDADTWPPPSRPNPFLPVGVQRRHNVPHGSPEREFEFARRITDHLLGSAGQVMVSYPLKDGDAELAPSPLIEGFEDVPFNESNQGWRMRIYQSRILEPVIDRKGPEVSSDSPYQRRHRPAEGTGRLSFQCVRHLPAGGAATGNAGAGVKCEGEGKSGSQISGIFLGAHQNPCRTGGTVPRSIAGWDSSGSGSGGFSDGERPSPDLYPDIYPA